ncbi:DUF6220 domain-containing protein [Actinocorallia sp. API 0066]|uniref:DUF6220 domain-containing protein n=1 Tax=Actinocorallia sp. API 0066 TaxID=2896846 RepID=UPI001E5F69D1|nr:DUF6220 domain-containing protein [Actinocorallia sp. API 0066]MCD0448662.1 DUF6220 domain-containing protein [Actinocorallia sp. API 0066]
MRKVFAGLAALLMLVIVLQFFLAASGAFDSAPNEEAFRPHRALGYMSVLLALVLTVVAAAIRLPGRIVGRCGALVGLAILQPVIAVIARGLGDSDTSTTAGQLVFGLHAVNGLMIMAVNRTVLQEARVLAGPASATGAGAGDGAPRPGSAPAS